MAAEDEGRTEEASEYKIQKARKEGRVAKSQELSSSIVLFFCIITLVFLSKWLLTQCVGIMNFYFSKCSNPDITNPSLVSGFFNFFLKIFLPFFAVGILSGIIGNIVQTRGFVISLKPLVPDLKRIVPNPVQYFKKTIFSLKGLFNIFKSIGKVAVIAAIGFFIIKKDLFVLLEIISNGQISKALTVVGKMASQLLIIVSVFFIVISIADFFVQRREFKESMKMTKQEQKQEYKEMEGDPEVKGRLKQMQRQLLSQNIPQAVAESDVVIANPEHYAVALAYKREEDDAPKVKAKGADELAQTIKRYARENNVPIVENRPVARGLYTSAEIGDIIPNDYLTVISTIYAKLDKFKKR